MSLLFKLDARGWPASLVSKDHEGPVPAGHIAFASWGAVDSWKAANEAKRPENNLPAPTVPVPEEVQTWQLEIALSQAGLLTAVQSAIAAIPDAAKKAQAQSRWTKKPTMQRTHPMIAQIGSALGLTPKQIDDVFISAALVQ